MYILIVMVCLAIVLIISFLRRNSEYSFAGEHLLITGGSSGIGLAVAIEAVCRGASVTLVARKQEQLLAAQELVQKHTQKPDQNVLIFTADVTEGVEALEAIVKKAEENAGPVTFLINCAGTSISYRFEETPVDDFRKMMDVNYLGSVYMTRAVLPYMKSRRRGKIIFVSSLAGLVGLYGYTAYSSSKFALLGLAQALQMELASYGISVTVSFPPDTDTPGFAEEIKSKPLETKVISETAGLFKPSTVAAKILKDARANCFMSSVGFEGWLLCSLCCGMSPVSSVAELISQVLTMGLLRITGFIYHIDCKRKIRHCISERERKNKDQ